MAKQVKAPKTAKKETVPPLPDNPQMRYSKSIVKQEEFFRRMADAQERIARAVEKQQPGKVEQVLAMGAAVVTIFGIVGIVDVIKKWIGG